MGEIDDINAGAQKVASNWKSWAIGIGLVLGLVVAIFLVIRIL